MSKFLQVNQSSNSYTITDGQPLNSNLTAISNLSSGYGFLYKNQTGSWVFDTNVYLTNADLPSSLINPNPLILRVNSGDIENTSLYTYDGGIGKNIDLISGTNISITTTSGKITISGNYATDTLSVLNLGVSTVGKLQSPKVLNEWIIGKNFATQTWVQSQGYLTSYVDTTYTAGTGLTLTGTTFSVNYGTTAGTAAQGNDSRIINGQTAFGWGNHASAGYLTSVPLATSTTPGLVELFSDTVQTVAASAVTTTASRTYGVQLNSAGQMVVNVPWTNTNTTYTAGTGLTLTGSAFSVNYGTTAGTAAQGNDSRINNGQTAFGWGDYRQFGLGATSSVNKNPDDFTNILSGIYGVSTTATGNPISGSSGTMLHMKSSASGNQHWSQFHILGNGATSTRAFISHGSSTRLAPWVELYHTENLTNISQLINDANYLTLDNLPAPSLVTSTSATGIVNVATTNTNTYLNIVYNGVSIGSSTQVTGSGSILVTSDSSGKLVITGTDTNTTYTAGTGLTLTGTAFSVNYGTTAGTAAQGNDSRIINGQTAFGWGNHAAAGYLTSVPLATSTTPGLVELFSDTVQTVAASAVSTTPSRTYGVQVNSAGQMVVNVPWVDTNTNTTYTAGTGLTLTGTAFSVNYGTAAGTAAQGNDSRIVNGQTAFGWGNHASAGYLTSVPSATSTVPGLVELFSDTVQTVASSAVSATASRTYGVQLNSAGQMVVNVPWIDSTISNLGTLQSLTSGVTLNGFTWSPYVLNEWINSKNYAIVNQFNNHIFLYSYKVGASSIAPQVLKKSDGSNFEATNTGYFYDINLTTDSGASYDGIRYILYHNGGSGWNLKRVGTPLTTEYSAELILNNGVPYIKKIGTTSTTQTTYILNFRAYIGYGNIGSTNDNVDFARLLGFSWDSIENKPTTLDGFGISDGATRQWVIGQGYLTSVPLATSTTPGLVELFSDTVQTVAASAVSTTASRTYGIQLNSAGQMVVNVPWVDTNTNTTYTAGTGLTLTGTAFSVNYGTTTGTAAQGNDSRINNGQTAFDWGNHASAGYSLSTHTHTFASLTSKPTTLSGYGITDAGISGAVSNSATGTTDVASSSNGSTFINRMQGGVIKESVKIVGAGATSVTHTTGGVITITSTDSNTTYVAGGGLTLTGTTFSVNYGTIAGTAAQGNDSRINNGQTAFGWGNHASAGYLNSFTELDPVYTASIANQMMVKGTIPDNADLNDYTITGIYNQGANAVVATFINSPTVRAMTLEVIRNSTSMIWQRVMDHSTNRIYTRNFSTSWSSWKTLALSTDISTNYLQLSGGQMNASATISLGTNWNSAGIMKDISSAPNPTYGLSILRSKNSNVDMGLGMSNQGDLVWGNWTNLTNLSSQWNKIWHNGNLSNVSQLTNDAGYITSVPLATSTTPGLVELFSDTVQTVASNVVTATASRTYGIQVNSAGQMVVNVPWVDTNSNTTYTAGTGLTLTGTTFSINYGTAAGTAAQGDDSRIINGQTAFGWGNHASAGYSLSTHTHTFASLTSKPTTLAGYGITDAGISGAVSNSATGTTDVASTSNGSTFINRMQGGVIKESVKIVGAGATSVTHAVGGVITITSTDSNTTYTAGTGLTLTGTVFSVNYGIVAGTAAQGNDSRINNGQTAFGWGNHASAGYLTSVTLATSTTPGLVELFSDTVQTVAASAVTATASRTYGVQLNNVGQMVVNVPWVDTNTNTTYTAGTGLTLTGTTFSVNYGTAAGTAAQGNDSRINNGQTAFGWGNHASAGYVGVNDIPNLKSDEFTIVAGNITSNVVTVTTSSNIRNNSAMVFINGIKIPKSKISISGNTIAINNNNIPFNIEVGDFLEVEYLY